MKLSNTHKMIIISISFGVFSTGYAAVISTEAFVAAGTAQPANGVYEAELSVGVSPNSSVTGGSIVGFGADWLAVAGPTDGSTTSLYKPQTNGLTTAAITHPSGGSLEYVGTHDDIIRRVRRPLDSYTPTNVYYMSGLIRIDDVAKGGSPDPVDPNGTALMGFTDNYSNADFNQTNDFYGLMWGFVNGSAVVHFRTNFNARENYVLGSAVAGQTNLFVLKLEYNWSGSFFDKITVWLNPTNVLTEGSTAPTAEIGWATSLVNITNDIDRLTFITQDWGASDVQFDEPRFGTTWDSVVTSSHRVPTPVYVAIEPLAGTTKAAISWNTDDWVSYALQAKTHLVVGAWADIVTNITGTGNTVIHTTDVNQVNSFYRVRVEE